MDSSPSPPIVLVDMDGVVADIETAFINSWVNRYPDLPHVPLDRRTSFEFYGDYPAEQQGLVQGILRTPGFCLGLAPIPGAVEAVQEMVACGINVRFLSAPLNYTACASEKHTWIAEHFGPGWVQRLILSKDKTLIHGTYLIDDKHEITGSMTPSWEHILFRAPHNRHVSSPRVLEDWSAWRDVIYA